MKLTLRLLFLFIVSAPPVYAQTVIRAMSEEKVYSIRASKTDTLGSIESYETKVALVVGNKNYSVTPLVNSVNDATDLSALLKQKKFDVITVLDGTKAEMREAVRTFASKIKGGAVGLFYYSGHGVQVDGENYLVPIDANFEYKEEVPDMCVSLKSILAFMETSNNKLNIVILDACRTNAFKSFSRSGEKGMGRVDAPTGTIVAYSTAPGKTASDGTGRNGLYTSKLLKYLNVPGLSIEDIFKQVRIEVSRDSDNRQIPWESNALMADFYFTPTAAN